MVNVDSGQAPVEVIFTDTSEGQLDTVEWDFGDGTSGTSAIHEYTKVGTYTVVLTVNGPGGLDSVSKIVTVEPGELATLVIMPEKGSLAVEESRSFKVTGFDDFDNEIEVSALLESDAGSVSVDGTLTAGTVSGHYKVTASVGIISNSVDIDVRPGALETVTINPALANLEIGGSQQFTIFAEDRFGNEISDSLTAWSVYKSLGDIDRDGNFVAGTQSGNFIGGVQADVVRDSNSISVVADLVVNPGAAVAIHVNPERETALVRPGDIQFSAIALDRYGNQIPDVAFLWDATDGSVTEDGKYTTETYQLWGTYEIRASAALDGRQLTGSGIVEIPAINWDFTQSLWGWRGGGNTTGLQSTPEGLSLVSSGFDPILVSPQSLPAGQPLKVEFRMKSDSNNDGDIHTQNSYQVFQVIADGEWHEYTVYLPAQLPNSDLRIDPAMAAGKVTIEWVTVTPINPRAPRTDRLPIPDLEFEYSTRFQHDLGLRWSYEPMDVVIDKVGNIYVTARSYHAIQKFDSNMKFVGDFPITLNPVGMVIGQEDVLYVAGNEEPCICVVTLDGILVSTEFGVRGTAPGQFRGLWDVAVDSNGYVYVVELFGHRVQVFDKSFNFVHEWGQIGSGRGEFMSPSGIAIDSENNVYVADRSNHRIQKFSQYGVFLLEWGVRGTGSGELFRPGQMAIDADNNVYVVDCGQESGCGAHPEAGGNRIQVFTSDGQFITAFGARGSEDGQFRSASGLVVDTDGRIFVADFGNNRIQVFKPK